MKSPLILQTTLFGFALCDGLLELGFTDAMYALLGFGIIGSIVWMWIVVSR